MRYHPAVMRLGVAVCLFGAALAGCTEDQGDGGLDAGIGDGAVAPVWVIEPGVPTTEDLLSIWGFDAADIYAVGFSGTVLHYDGLAWNIESVSSTVPLTSVHGATKEGPLFAVGWNGTVLMRDAASRTWIDAAPSSTITEDLFGVRLGADDNGLAIGDEGRVLGWNGRVWRAVAFQVPGEFSGQLIEPKTSLKSVWTIDGASYYFSGSGGAAYRSANRWQSFESIDTRQSAPLRGIWGESYGNVYAVGLEGLILNYQGEWRRVRNDGAEELPNVFLFGIDGIDSSDITVVGWRGTAVRYLGGMWSVEGTGVDVDLRNVWIDRATGVAYAVGASGTIIRRDPPPPGAADAGL
jgi:hypothetical protein